ncbi:hypothetical protein [Bradyrhizobium neotropicale]|uniref:hypothetical protein n=1 Tax=Bradyrhizobium neotropicale TaxID=1497615 RepID=UPI001AD7523F|nr:hypothetical protein [Bradyrhizobium neotropicale]MBO4227824.1 hypothetical protein [Bradyrhizobium neotropicale]
MQIVCRRGRNASLVESKKNTRSRSARSSAMSGTRHALQSEQANLKKVERYQILERWHATCQFAGNRCGQMNGEL